MNDTCTTEGCGRATSLYLCTACIVELDELLQDVPALISFLAYVRAGTAVPKKPGGGGGGHPGSREPGSVDAMLLQAWLGQLPDRAHTAATSDPEAGRKLYMARIWVRQARSLVWGPEEEQINHSELRERVRDIAPPMPTKELVPWLKAKAGIIVKAKDIRNWAHRGKLKPVERGLHPTYHPHEVLNAWHDTRV